MFKIGMVVEGKTDHYLMTAALQAILSDKTDFTVTVLQPSFGVGLCEYGEGWGGVYRWCSEVAGVPVTLQRFDLVIVQIDADVAEKSYRNINVTPQVDNLPCRRPCPPPENTVLALENVLTGWLGGQLPAKLMLCVPSRAIEAWLVPVLFPDDRKKRDDLECSRQLNSWLSTKDAGKLTTQKGDKNTAAYEPAAKKMQKHWQEVKSACHQAVVFEERVRTLLGCLG